MNVFLRVDINIIAMLLLGIVVAIAYNRLDRRDLINKAFLTVSLVIILELLFETLACLINGYPHTGLIPVSAILHICLFVAAPLLSYFWYHLIKSIILPDKKYTRLFSALMFIPVLVNAVLTFLSPVFHSVFFIDSTNHYHRGPYFIIFSITTYFYILYSLVVVVINRKKLIRHEFIPLFIFNFLPIAGGIGQSVFYGTLLMWSCAAFSLIIVYIFLQERMIQMDYLTGAWNRNSFDHYIMRRSRQNGDDKIGIIYADIDCLKEINDEYGHSEGDYAIKTSIDIIRGVLRKQDIIVRMGGDEFIIILDCDSMADLEQTIHRIGDAFMEYNNSCKRNYQLECSFGADIFVSGSNRSMEEFLHHIDNLMYKNKFQKKEQRILNRL